MNEKLVKDLIREGYLTEKGEKSLDYTFFPEDFNSDKNLEEIRTANEFLKALSGKDWGEKLGKLEEFVRQVQDYENIRESFETGDYLRQVHAIKLKEECRKVMEEKGFYPLLW